MAMDSGTVPGETGELAEFVGWEGTGAGGFDRGDAFGSGGVEADLDGFVEELVECIGGGDGVAAKGFEEEACEIAEGAEGTLDVALPAAVALEHLAEGVCHLEEEVEDLGRVWPFGVGVLHREAPVLL